MEFHKLWSVKLHEITISVINSSVYQVGSTTIINERLKEKLTARTTCKQVIVQEKACNIK